MSRYTDPKVVLDTLATSKMLVLIQFSADWCAPCRAMEPVMQQIARDYEGRVVVLKVDLDGAAELAESYNVRSIPALLLFRDGELAERFAKALTLSRLSLFLDWHLEQER